MSKLKNTIKKGVIAGVCGIGLCALARKLKLSCRIAEFAHSIDGVPFPGANMYVFLASRHMRPMYAKIAEEIVSAGEFDTVLDLGTGAGYLPIEIALRNPEIQAVGIDRSNDMIQIAHANAQASRLGKTVEFNTGDPTNLPFPGRYFDLVVSVIALHHWSDPIAVLEEVYHILQPGGELWIYDYMREIPSEIWDASQAKLPLLLRIPFMIGPVSSCKAAYVREELVKMISKTHFDLLGIEPRSFTLFNQEMPVFQRIRLKKPEQVRET